MPPIGLAPKTSRERQSVVRSQNPIDALADAGRGRGGLHHQSVRLRVLTKTQPFRISKIRARNVPSPLAFPMAEDGRIRL